MALAGALRGALRPSGGFDPLHTLWRVLTSVRFAIYLLAFVALGALLGTVFPQIPGPMRGNEGATAAWVEFQRGKFGPYTTPLYRLGLFDVFHTYWFNGLLVVLLLAVAVCTANRFAPTWRSVTRPQTRVPDTYFTRARHRARRDGPVDAGAVVAALRRRRYMVRRYEEGGAVYLYADRYRWAQLATFVSHLSLILLLAGGLVTKLFGYDVQLFIAEGRTAPVFPVANNRQMQLEVKQFSEPIDGQGNILDFRSHVVLYSRGKPVKEGDITVNGPLKWNGFVFHQIARQVNGAEVKVRDARTGQVVYSEVLDLSAAAPRPRLVVLAPDGRTVFDQRLVLPLFDERGPAGVPTALVANPAGAGTLLVGLRLVGKQWWMEVRGLGMETADVRLSLTPGGSGQVGGYTFTYADLAETAWAQVEGIPGMQDGAVALMPSAEGAGVRNAAIPGVRAGSAETPTLTITGPITWAPAFPDQGIVTLAPDQPVQIGDYVYTFTGRRPFTGVVARRDPGTGFVWVAVTLFIAAVCVTFYFPRRRLWAKLTPDATLLAGVADRGSAYGEELQRLLDGLPAAQPGLDPARHLTPSGAGGTRDA